jgi:hypothetical protein
LRSAPAQNASPLPGQDRDVDAVVVADLRPGLDEQVLQLGVDGVLGLGAVEREVRDAVALLEEQLGHRRIMAATVIRSPGGCEQECRSAKIVRHRKGAP